MQLALRDLRDEVGDDVVLIADLCVDEYTDHGHCGDRRPRRRVDNDATLELYDAGRGRPGRRRRRHHRAERDDGRPGRARSGAALDAAGHPSTAILAYAAKYASALYGPFRDAVDVHDRRTAATARATSRTRRNAREALEEIRADVAEGADIVMVKPALAYLDIIAAAPAARRRAGRGVPRVAASTR